MKKPAADPKVLSNFRIISLLPMLSKLLEKRINKQLSSFLETNCLLHDTQSGLQFGYSTKAALLEVSEHIKENLDSDTPV